MRFSRSAQLGYFLSFFSPMLFAQSFEEQLNQPHLMLMVSTSEQVQQQISDGLLDQCILKDQSSGQQITLDCSREALKSGFQLSLFAPEPSTATQPTSDDSEVTSEFSGSGSLVWGFVVMLLGLALGRSQKIKQSK